MSGLRWLSIPACCLLLVVMVGVAAGVEPAGKGGCLPNPHSGVCWSEVSFSAHKFLLSAATTLRVGSVSAEEVANELRNAPAGGEEQLRSPQALQVTLESDLPFGRFETASALLDPIDGAALQSEKLVTGGKQYWKLRRYTSEGYFQWRAEPAGRREKKQERQAWSERSEELVPWNRPLPASTRVTDSYALIYLISAAGLDHQGATLEVVILSKKHLVQLEFTAGELTTLEVDYTEVVGEQERQRRATVRVRTVTGTGRPLTGGDGERGQDVDLGFLGMKGELTVYLEEGTGIPIEVVGKADKIGKLRVALERVIMAAAAP